MESRVAYVQRIESELADKEEQLARLRSEVRALRLQLTELRSGADAPQPVTELTYSDAVVVVLRQDGGALSPQQIHELLLAAGRDDELRSLGGILQALKKRGRVERVGRGQWVIADGA